MKNLKKNLFGIGLTFSMILGIAFSFIPQEANAYMGGSGCEAGGPGATSCSITQTLEILGQSGETTVSVSCGAGYYACCNNSIFTTPSATCKLNKPTS